MSLVIKKIQQIVTELFIKGRKPNISLVFTVQSYNAVPNSNGWNCTHYFNHSFDIDLKDFMNLYKKCTVKPYFFF